MNTTPHGENNVKMYNYFMGTTEQGGKPLYSTVYRAPVGHGPFGDSVEHYMGRGRWGLMQRVDPEHPHAGHRLGNPGAKRFPRDGKSAHAFMLRTARNERRQVQP